MNNDTPQPVPLASFKNVVVTVTEDAEGNLYPQCVEKIGCSAADTILNFQIAQVKEDGRDYQFEAPGLRGDVGQLGLVTISKSGKMLTVCNENSDHGQIHITLKVFDNVTPAKRGKFDPEVLNQPDGIESRR